LAFWLQLTKLQTLDDQSRSVTMQIFA